MVNQNLVSRRSTRLALAAVAGAIGVGAVAGPSLAATVPEAQQSKSGAAVTAPNFSKGSQLTVVNNSNQVIFVQTQSYFHKNIKFKDGGAVLTPGQSMEVDAGSNEHGTKPDITGSVTYTESRTVVDFHAKTPRTIGYPWMGVGPTRDHNPVWDIYPAPPNMLKSFAAGETQSLAFKGKTVVVSRGTSDPVLTDFTMFVK